MLTWVTSISCRVRHPTWCFPDVTHQQYNYPTDCVFIDVISSMCVATSGKRHVDWPRHPESSNEPRNHCTDYPFIELFAPHLNAVFRIGRWNMQLLNCISTFQDICSGVWEDIKSWAVVLKCRKRRRCEGMATRLRSGQTITHQISHKWTSVGNCH